MTHSKTQILRWLFAGLMGLLLVLWGGKIKQTGISQPAIAQFIQPEEIAPLVYERLPDFPKENQYLSIETGEVASENSLVTRFLRYHLYIKNRSPIYRLDWKITLADYLGVHDPMLASQYPGGTTLQENPMERDIATIRSLNRKQRAELVDTLSGIFNPNAARSPEPSSPSTPEPPTRPTYQPPTLPPPGAADLLKGF